jgi:hypothetical protein
LTVLATVPTVFTLPPFYVCATNYYVGTNGSDSYTAAQAQTNNTPWRTISHALSVLGSQGGTHGGVCVNVGSGMYTDHFFNNTVMGSADATNGYFVLRSQTPHGAIIQVPANVPDSTMGFQFQNTPYVVVDGFVLAGDHSQGNINGHGIKLEGSSHHCRVYNNVIYGFGGAAIHARVDYVEARNKK